MLFHSRIPPVDPAASNTCGLKVQILLAQQTRRPRNTNMKKVRHFVASVSRIQEGKTTEEEWPVYAWTHEMATDMAFSYALQVLKIKGDFELRVVGS
jgi:hypothetical protein